MKKVIYTFSFVALLAIAGKAQSSNDNAKQAKKEAAPAAVLVTPEGSAAKPENSATMKSEDAPATEPKTRMAINEKGVPASKATKEKPKDEKPHGNPGQPAATEKK